MRVFVLLDAFEPGNRLQIDSAAILLLKNNNDRSYCRMAIYYSTRHHPLESPSPRLCHDPPIGLGWRAGRLDFVTKEHTGSPSLLYSVPALLCPSRSLHRDSFLLKSKYSSSQLPTLEAASARMATRGDAYNGWAEPATTPLQRYIRMMMRDEGRCSC